MAEFDDPIPWSQRTRDEQIDFVLRSWRLALPTVLLVGLIVVMMWPVWLPGPVMPQLAFLGLCTWCLRRPDLMHPSVAFLIGLLQDLLMGGAVGVDASLFALTCFALRSQAPVFAARPYHFEWMVVGGLIAAHQLLFAGFSLMVHVGALSALSLGFQGVLTFLLYPAIVWLFARVQRKFVDRF